MTELLLHGKNKLFWRFILVLNLVVKIIVIYVGGTSTASAVCVFLNGETTRN